MCVTQRKSDYQGRVGNWIISDEKEIWCVKLDVQDLEGYLDSTQRQRASTLAGRVVAVLGRFPPDAQRKLRILRTMCTHAVLDGVEAFLVSRSSLPNLGLHLLLQSDPIKYSWQTLVLFSVFLMASRS